LPFTPPICQFILLFHLSPISRAKYLFLLFYFFKSLLGSLGSNFQTHLNTQRPIKPPICTQFIRCSHVRWKNDGFGNFKKLLDFLRLNFPTHLNIQVPFRLPIYCLNLFHQQIPLLSFYKKHCFILFYFFKRLLGFLILNLQTHLNTQVPFRLQICCQLIVLSFNHCLLNFLLLNLKNFNLIMSP
jgi:hypothetical protein